jgi:hypothetical protein
MNMKNKSFITEVQRMKTLMGVSILNEQFLAKGIMKLALGNIDTFVRQFGDNLKKPLQELLTLTDDAAQMRKLDEIAKLNPDAAKALRVKIFTQLSKNTQESLDAIIKYALDFDEDKLVTALNDGIDAFFDNIDTTERKFLIDLMSARNSKIDDTLESLKVKPKPTQPQAAKQLTRTDKILQGMGIKSKSLEDQIRSGIKIYANKTDDEIAKILKQYEDDVVKNPTIKKQLDDIISKQSLGDKWRKMNGLQKVGVILSIPVFSPAVAQLLYGLGVLYVGNYFKLWDIPIHRWVSTAGGTILDIEDIKESAPTDIRDSIYENKDGDYVIYISNNEEYLIEYDISKDKYYYIVDDVKYPLSEY